MSRKLRFFRDQISKAGLLSSVHPVLQPDIELEELEVHLLLPPISPSFGCGFYNGSSNVNLKLVVQNGTNQLRPYLESI